MLSYLSVYLHPSTRSSIHLSIHPFRMLRLIKKSKRIRIINLVIVQMKKRRRREEAEGEEEKKAGRNPLGGRNKQVRGYRRLKKKPKQAFRPSIIFVLEMFAPPEPCPPTSGPIPQILKLINHPPDSFSYGFCSSAIGHFHPHLHSHVHSYNLHLHLHL